jgi:hypothetical protein
LTCSAFQRVDATEKPLLLLPAFRQTGRRFVGLA